MPIINLKEGSLPKVPNKRQERYATLRWICARMEQHMKVPFGSIREGSQERFLSLGRDMVINEAWREYKIPMSTIASYLGKTRQGIHAAIKREDEVKKLRDLMNQCGFKERRKGNPDEEMEKHSEGRYHEPARQTYED